MSKNCWVDLPQPVENVATVVIRPIAGFVGATAGVIGTFWGALLALSPPTDAATTSRDGYTLIFLGILAFVAFGTYTLMEVMRDRRAPAERARLIADITQEVKVGFIETLKAFPPGTLGEENHLIENEPDVLQEAEPVPKTSALWNRAETAVANLPKPTSLRQQAFDIVKAGRANLRQYYGTLDADEWVPPEFIQAWVPLQFPVKDKIEAFLKRRILREESKLPMTIERMAMWLEDVEKAAGDLRDDIPPAEPEYREEK